MRKVFITLAAMAAFIACEDMPDQAPVMENAPLKINVGVQTKGLITETTLPDASEIGAFFYDESNVTYDELTYQNVKFSATGEGQSQTWAAERYIGASATKGHLYAYYPYSADASNMNAVPVIATPSNQADYMWATPVQEIDNKNSSVSLVMNHALAAIRFKIEKGGYQDAGVLSQISFSGNNIAKGATLDITTGALANYSETGALCLNTFDPVTLSETPATFEYIVVPVVGATEVISIALTVDGKEYTVDTPAVELQQNTIHEYALSMNGDFIVTKVNITPWNTVTNNTLSVETTKPVTVKIKHVDGSLWTADAWTAGLAEGVVTNEQATGIAIPDPRDPYSYMCVLHPTAKMECTWSSTTNAEIDGALITDGTTAGSAIALADYAGQANTDAILAAVAAGTIEDAPAAQFCAETTFADGKKGYLPAAGELAQIFKLSQVKTCLKACGASAYHLQSAWSSTQSGIGSAWRWGTAGNALSSSSRSSSMTAYPVSAF